MNLIERISYKGLQVDEVEENGMQYLYFRNLAVPVKISVTSEDPREITEKIDNLIDDFLMPLGLLEVSKL